jgi:MbtH protein
MQDEVDLGPHRVVVYHEEQFSLLPTGVALPAGWRDANHAGSKAQCLAYIREAWIDLRPRSVRRAID